MIKLTAKLVAAYVENNALTANELVDFIRSTHAALATAVTADQAAEPQRAEPAISVRKSVTPEAIYCLDCGKAQKMLKRHIATAHGLSVEDYRAKWGLASSYQMVAPHYAEHRSALAKKIGLGTSRKRKPKVEAAPAPVAVEKPKHGRKKVAAE